jgi:hypothetical protein
MSLETYSSFFIASAGAAAALVGLLFVAIAVDPEKTVAQGASPQRRAAASSAFFALINAFFISLVALIPSSTTSSFGGLVIVMSGLGILSTLSLSWSFVAQRANRAALRQGIVLLLASFILYGLQLFSAIYLLQTPRDTSSMNMALYVIVAIYGLAFTRAWELIGGQRFSLLGMLGIINHHAPPAAPPANVAATRSAPLDTADD